MTELSCLPLPPTLHHPPFDHVCNVFGHPAFKPWENSQHHGEMRCTLSTSTAEGDGRGLLPDCAARRGCQGSWPGKEGFHETSSLSWVSLQRNQRREQTLMDIPFPRRWRRSWRGGWGATAAGACAGRPPPPARPRSSSSSPPPAALTQAHQRAAARRARTRMRCCSRTGAALCRTSSRARSPTPSAASSSAPSPCHPGPHACWQ